MISGREFIAYSYGALSTLQGMPNQLKSMALDSIAQEAKISKEDLHTFLKEIQEFIKYSSDKKMAQLEELMKTGKIPKEQTDEDLR